VGTHTRTHTMAFFRHSYQAPVYVTVTSFSRHHWGCGAGQRPLGWTLWCVQ